VTNHEHQRPTRNGSHNDFGHGNLRARTQVTSDINDLEAAFDPAKPLTFTFEYEVMPPISWKKSYKDLEVELE